MSIEELYNSIGGNLADAKTRLPEKFIVKYIQKYPSDGSFNELVEAWDNQNEKGIFESSHTMKGLCANLSLDRLFKTSSAICEAYRPGHEDSREAANVPALMEVLKVDYADTIKKIKEFSSQQK